MFPTLDHYYGRSVVAVAPEATAEHEADWAIELDGTVFIHNADRRRTVKPDIEGMVFLAAVYDEENTILKFGHIENGESVFDEDVSLTATSYAISDPGFEESPYFPQRVTPEEAAILPVDPSPERVVDGPSEEWQEAQRAAQRDTDNDPED